MSESRVERVLRVVQGARRLSDPNDPLGRSARELLPDATGLSPEGVEYALSELLETQPSSAELAQLVNATPVAARAHVLLSANVFSGALRAIAIALASSGRVDVMRSRRELLMAQLLHEASRGAFRLVEELAPAPGDHVWAYGRSDTLVQVRGELPAGVVFHAHGSGMGLALVDCSELDSGQRIEAANGLAADMVAFDQRGCLSPRVALVRGPEELARDFAEQLARGLFRLEHDVPRGRMTEQELADIVRYRDTMAFAGDLLHAGKGYLGLDLAGAQLLVPPVGRVLHLLRVEDFAPAVAPLSRELTCVGTSSAELAELGARLLPGARCVPLGRMQKPPLDGPVDRRGDLAGEVL